MNCQYCPDKATTSHNKEYLCERHYGVLYKKRIESRAGFAVMMVVSFGINAQRGIVAAGNNTETIGEVFPIMQQMYTLIQASLNVPKFEIPKPQPKPIVKKENWFIKLIKKIFGL